MANSAIGFLGEGARLLARRKAMLAWLYGAVLALGVFASLALSSAIGPTLNNSLYADRLAHGFDIAAVVELLGRPTVQLGPPAVLSVAATVLLALLLLFLTAGIAAELLAPERLGTERFFQTCGAFWWRMLRLVLLTLVILIPTLGILSAIRGAIVRAADRSWHLRLPFVLFITISVIIQLIGLALRAWFDTSEFHLLRTDDAAARRALGAGRRMTSGHRWQLLWMYLLPCFAIWAATAVWLLLWRLTPPTAVGVLFILGQLIVLTWIAGRLWQRAAQAMWFRAHEPVVVEAPLIESVPAEPVATEPAGSMPATEVDLP